MTREPAPAPVELAAPTGERATASTTAASGAHRLRVTLRGAGSVVGRVVSSPAGLDCAVTSSKAGPNEKRCEASLPAGRVTLTFTPDGAASTAQFSVVRASQRSMCEGKMGATTCAVQLDRDLEIDVFPISAPPPPP